MKIKNALMLMGAGMVMGCTYGKYKKEMDNIAKTLENKMIKKTTKMVNNM